MPGTSNQPASDPKPMDEVALIAAIDDADNRSYGSNLSNLTAELSAQRALSIDLYLGKDVDPPPPGQSSVIDRTVFETVQWILPSLCRIFANGDDVVTLLPLGPQDVDQAKQEAAYLNWLITVKHPWFDVFLEFATDALLTKNAYILVYKDNNRKVEIEKYEEQTKAGVAYLMQDRSVQIIDAKQYPAPDLPPDPVLDSTGRPIVDANGQPMTTPTQLYDVTIRRTNLEKDVCIRVLPPERCKVDQRSFSWRLDDRCNYFEYWEETTLTELREQGYEIPTDIADDPEIYTQEDYARDQFGERRLERYKPSDPSMRRVKARMIWIRVDADGDGVAELLQITRVGRRILAMEEVSRIPVASGVACPLPHRHVGISIGDMVSDIQRIKTSMMRQGLDSMYASMYPQKVVNESLVNMDDVLIRRPDGIIRATDIDRGVRYENVPFVFPQAIQGLEYMDQVRQARTGVSNGFSGIDTKDLMSNAQPGTVNQMTSMAAQRVEQIARILAFAIEDLFSIVHEQVLKMGHKRQTVQLSGKWVEIDPGGWQKRTDFKTCVAFSAGNKDTQVSRLMAMAQKQLEALMQKVPVCTPENYYNTLVELSKAADFSSPDRFWTDPRNIPQPPAPPPPEQIQVENIKSETQKTIKAAELAQREVESQRKAELDKYAIDSEAGLQMIREQHGRDHDIAIEGLKTSHAALLSTLDNKLNSVTNAGATVNNALAKAHEGISTTGANVAAMHSNLGDLADHIKHVGRLAMASKKVVKNDKGEIEGVDVVDHDGTVLAHHKAIKDPKTGRVTGMHPPS
jgi:hypothetical protein